MQMNKYIRYIGPVLMTLGIMMLVFGSVCLECAGGAIGRIEDAFYYLDLNLYHGRFTSSDAHDVLRMLDDIGISDAVVSGFECFAISARYSVFILGIFIAIVGGVLALRRGIELPGNTSGALNVVWKKICLFCGALVEWMRMKLSGRICPVCGEKLIKGAVFCGNCGKAVEDDKMED